MQLKMNINLINIIIFLLGFITGKYLKNFFIIKFLKLSKVFLIGFTLNVLNVFLKKLPNLCLDLNFIFKIKQIYKRYKKLLLFFF